MRSGAQVGNGPDDITFSDFSGFLDAVAFGADPQGTAVGTESC
jgi:hypothetical protein